MSYSRIEQETTINYNAEESTAEVYTCDPAVMRKLDKLCKERPDLYQCTEVTQTGVGKMYTCPKKVIRFANPRVYTEEQKKAMTAHLNG